MTGEPRSKAAWGSGRGAFLSLLETIRAEVARGLPLIAVFESHKPTLGVGYKAFCKLVSRYAEDAKPSRRHVAGARPAGDRVPPSRPSPIASGILPDARQQPNRRPDFRH